MRSEAEIRAFIEDCRIIGNIAVVVGDPSESLEVMAAMMCAEWCLGEGNRNVIGLVETIQQAAGRFRELARANQKAARQ